MIAKYKVKVTAIMCVVFKNPEFKKLVYAYLVYMAERMYQTWLFSQPLPSKKSEGS